MKPTKQQIEIVLAGRNTHQGLEVIVLGEDKSGLIKVRTPSGEIHLARKTDLIYCG